MHPKRYEEVFSNLWRTDKFSEHAVSQAANDACQGLIHAQKDKKYPSVYDGSSTFFVSDAILFASAISRQGEISYRGPSRDLRLIIDSSCKFFGIVIKSNTSPDRRCYQPADPSGELDLYDSRVSRSLPVFRGYKCGYKIFGNSQVEKILKEAYENSSLWQSQETVISFSRLLDIGQLFGREILLLPSKISYTPEQVTEVTSNPSLIVIDSEYRLLGMVNKVGNQWEKCLELWEKEPEPFQSVDNTRNSIGEWLFSGVREYRCGEFLYSRESVNSHMQMACTLIRPPDGYNGKKWKIKLTPLRLLPSISRSKLWKINLRLPENNEYNYAQRVSNNGVVILDQQCNFYGVFWYIGKDVYSCDGQSFSLVS